MEDSVLDEAIEEVEINPFLPLFPYVYQGTEPPLNTAFNAVTIKIDGRLQADLEWQTARKQAQQAVAQGFVILWQIDLGFFNSSFSLINQTHFLSLILALQHFRDSLWQEFKTHTLGLILFQGSADFTHTFLWDNEQEQNLKGWWQERYQVFPSFNVPTLDLFALEPTSRLGLQLFCRDVALDYLNLLAAGLPDSLSLFLCLDATSLQKEPIEQLQVIHPEKFERFNLILKGSLFPLQSWGWEKPTKGGYWGILPLERPEDQTEIYGVCIPALECVSAPYEQLIEAFRHLQAHAFPFRLIPENRLTTQWDELDYLFYAPGGLSVQGKRKLQGFCAAGGTVISMGTLLGLAQEISFQEWLDAI